MRSQWDSRIIAFMFALIFFYGIVSFVLCLVAIRHFLPQRFRTPSFMSKRTCISIGHHAGCAARIGSFNL